MNNKRWKITNELIEVSVNDSRTKYIYADHFVIDGNSIVFKEYVAPNSYRNIFAIPSIGTIVELVE